MAFAGTTAFAGGFADEIVEAPVVVVEPTAPAGSLPGWVIPAVLVAGLVALAVSGDDSDDTRQHVCCGKPAVIGRRFSFFGRVSLKMRSDGVSSSLVDLFDWRRQCR